MAPRAYKIALVVLTELSSLLYSGTVFGWAPILLILKKEGLFSELCNGEASEDGWCDAQKERLGLIFTFAAVIYSASGIFVGAFLDAAGPIWGVIAACLTSVIGFYLFACSWGWASDWIIIAGYSFIGVGGMFFFQCAFKAQYAFPLPNGGGFEKQTLIIAIATTFGDASVCMWLLFESLYTRFDMSLATIFKWYIAGTVLLSIILGSLWHICGPDILAQRPQSEEVERINVESGVTKASKSGVYGSVSKNDVDEERAGKGGGGLRRKSFWEQLLTLEFLQMMAFQCVHTTRANLYLGLLAYFYESEQFTASGASSVTIERFVNITSALVPLGCFCAPIVERLIDQLGFGWTAQAIAVAGIAQSLIMLSSSLPLQYAAAAIFLVYRANVFAFPPTFAGQIFGPRTCGRITGMMYTLMAPVQFVLSPALTVTLTTFHDSFRPLNLIEMAALVPMIALTCLLQVKSKEPAVAMPKNNNRNTLPIPSSLSYSPGGYSPARPIRPMIETLKDGNAASRGPKRRAQGDDMLPSNVKSDPGAFSPLLITQISRPQEQQYR